MSQPAFDTHKAVETLSDAEPGEPLAEAIVDTIGAAMENVATKDDIKQLQGDIKHVHERIDNVKESIDVLEKSVNSRFDNVDSRFDNVNEKIDNVKDSVDVLEKSMDAKFIDQTNRIIRWSVGAILTAAALLAALNMFLQSNGANIP